MWAGNQGSSKDVDAEEQPEDEKVKSSFKMASLDEFGIINIWIAIELEEPDWGGLESDFGLSVGGKMKIIKSATIKLGNPSRELSDQSLRVFDFQFHPEDNNQYG